MKEEGRKNSLGEKNLEERKIDEGMAPGISSKRKPHPHARGDLCESILYSGWS